MRNRQILQYLRVFCALLPLLALTAAAQELPNFDEREAIPGPNTPAAARQARSRALVQSRTQGLQSYAAAQRAASPGMRVIPNRHGLAKVVQRDGKSLTAASGDLPENIARNFLRSNSALFPFSAGEINDLRVSAREAGAATTHLTLTQTVNGIDVFEGQLKFTLGKTGELIQAGADNAVPGLTVSTTPTISEAEAQSLALDGAQGTFIRASEFVVFALDSIAGRLAYRLFLETDPRHLYEILIDAQNGNLLYRHNLYVHAGQGNVFVQSPAVGERQTVAFPDAWLAPGITVTSGNNVDAWVDSNGDDKPDTTVLPGILGGRAFSSTQDFSFTYADGLTSVDPRSSKPASITSLFYLLNVAHDYYYSLGFTEAAGNFQVDNFGKGGLGGDPVIAEDQNGFESNNAAFATLPEGTSPRAFMGLFTRGTSRLTDDLDTAYDGTVVLHEAGHGVSNRLVGAGTSTSCLDQLQSAGMGEGWSDYFAASYYNTPIVGVYVTQNYTNGIRSHSYEAYPNTYEDVGRSTWDEHATGEIWAATLWDLRTALGQSVIDKLVVDGLKGTPCNPSMTDARDAILAADQAANSGANRATIWSIFAKHGLGFSSLGIDGTLVTGTEYDAAYDMPADLQGGLTTLAITSRPLSVISAAGDPYAYNVQATNPNNGVLSYVLNSGPPGMTIDSATGKITWTTSFTSQRVKITVTDGKGGKVVQGFVAPVLTPLLLGVPITVDLATNDTGYGYIDVPAGTGILQVSTRGASGDADLEVTSPAGSLSSFLSSGSNETATFVAPEAGRWTYNVTGATGVTGLSIAANSIIPAPVSGNTILTSLSGIKTSDTFYRVTVPSGTVQLFISTSLGLGDVDLYVKQGLPPGRFSYTSSSFHNGNNESISISNPVAGDWFIDMRGYVTYSGVQLEVAVIHSVAVETAALGSGAVGDPYSTTLRASGGTVFASLPYTWALSSGTLPPGLILDSATGTISGTPTSSTGSPFSFSVTVKDSNGVASPAQVLSIVIAPGAASPVLNFGGIGPVYSAATTIQPGSWVSIYGINLAPEVTVWNNDFPTQLGGVTVTINGKPAYLWFVSPTQINLQAPDDTAVGPVEVVVTTPSGRGTALVSLAPASPSFSLLDTTHAAGVILLGPTYTTYDLLGPSGAFPYATRPVKAGEILVLYGVGFGPTVPNVVAGKIFTGGAATVSPVTITIGEVNVPVAFAGITGAGLYQFNLTIPEGIESGDKPLKATVNGVSTLDGPVVTIQ